jgi:hypothetical protein
MRTSHRRDAIILFCIWTGRRYDRDMTNERVISVPLSQEDWQAFLASVPEPVAWIRRQIAQAITQERERRD